jgi:hypothetical protein
LVQRFIIAILLDDIDYFVDVLVFIACYNFIGAILVPGLIKMIKILKVNING